MKKISMILFRKNLKFFRDQNNYSQRELSESCNYDRSYIGKIERGERIPNLPVIERLATALDVNTNKFFQLNTQDCYQALAELIVNRDNENFYNDLRQIRKAYDWGIHCLGLISLVGKIHKIIDLKIQKNSTCCINNTVKKSGQFWNINMWEKVNHEPHNFQNIIPHISNTDDYPIFELPIKNTMESYRLKFVPVDTSFKNEHFIVEIDQKILV